MNIDNEKYKKYADAHAPSSPIIKDCISAFLIGGTICAIGQLFIFLYKDVGGMDKKDAGTLCSVTLIFLAVLLSGLGFFEKIAKRAGGGTLVPITGFANAVVSPAIDSKAEGFILGVGAKIFTVAGPVLLYGNIAGVIWGVIYYFISLITSRNR
jgi:stage V sporulation protein AC